MSKIQLFQGDCLFRDNGVPRAVVKKLYSPILSGVIGRPIFDIMVFDDYLHDVVGNYESEGKSMQDVMEELYGDNAVKMAYYLGVEP